MKERKSKDVYLPTEQDHKDFWRRWVELSGNGGECMQNDSAPPNRSRHKVEFSATIEEASRNGFDWYTLIDEAYRIDGVDVSRKEYLSHWTRVVAHGPAVDRSEADPPLSPAPYDAPTGDDDGSASALIASIAEWQERINKKLQDLLDSQRVRR